MNTLIIIRGKILVLNDHMGAPIMLTIVPIMVNRYSACSSISLRTCLWCPFVGPHLNTHHLNIGA